MMGGEPMPAWRTRCHPDLVSVRVHTAERMRQAWQRRTWQCSRMQLRSLLLRQPQQARSRPTRGCPHLPGLPRCRRPAARGPGRNHSQILSLCHALAESRQQMHQQSRLSFKQACIIEQGQLTLQNQNQRQQERMLCSTSKLSTKDLVCMDLKQHLVRSLLLH